MPRAAAIYCRISDDRDGSAAGVKRQEADCRELAAKRGWPVAHVFTDNDTSAWSTTKTRPAYRRMLDAIKDGDIDAVIVWHLDRLHRRPIELEQFFDICDAAGVKDLASVTGDVDLSTHDGRFMARILGAVARKESDDKSRRTRRKHLELAEAGRPVGGSRPFGYEADKVTVNRAEADLIVEAAQRVLAGDSLRSICLDWNGRAVRTTAGRLWRPVRLRKVLLSHRIAGNRSLGEDGPVVAKAIWPGIVDEDTHRRLRALLLARDRGAFSTRSYLLSGFVICGRCDKRLISRRKRDVKSYVCDSGPMRHGCGGISVSGPPLEALVIGMVFDVLDQRRIQVEASEADLQAALDGLAAELGDDERALERLAQDHYADRLISKGEFLAARQAIDARVTSGRRQLVRLQAQAARAAAAEGAGTLPGAWDHMTLGQRRSIIDSVLDGVVIGPHDRAQGNQFQPSRIIEVRWRA